MRLCWDFCATLCPIIGCLAAQMCFLPSLQEPLNHCALCPYYGTHSPTTSFAPPLGTFALLRVALNLCPFGLSLPSQILSPDLMYRPEGGSLNTMNKNKLGRSVLDPIALLVNKPGRSLLPFVTSEVSATCLQGPLYPARLSFGFSLVLPVLF